MSKFFGCFFGHDWTQWVQYTQEITVTPVGLIYGSMRGKSFDKTEDRQHRTCKRCGFKQDEEVSES